MALIPVFHLTSPYENYTIYCLEKFSIDTRHYFVINYRSLQILLIDSYTCRYRKAIFQEARNLWVNKIQDEYRPSDINIHEKLEFLGKTVQDIILSKDTW